MFRTSLKVAFLSGFFLVLLFSTSCKKADSPTYTDVDAIKDYISYHPDIFSADVFDTSSASAFFREISGKDYWIRINFHEPDSVHLLKSADVSWEDSIQGVFHTFISGTEYTRNLRAFSRVQAYFEQWGNSGDLYRGWLLMKISNVQVYCLPSPSVGFSNLEIDTSGTSNPLSLDGLRDLKSILQLKRSNTVKFTIQAADPTDLYYLEIYDENGWLKRPFTYKGDDIFSVVWTPTSQDYNTYRHFYIDCIKSESVEDSSFNQYDSRTWGVIYRVKQ
ncbi:MAG TPA: hypothetical protein VMT04_01980 [Terriglobales bacterium]|nr:hypothetical protein [Terriglobales bacterium]